MRYIFNALIVLLISLSFIFSIHSNTTADNSENHFFTDFYLQYSEEVILKVDAILEKDDSKDFSTLTALYANDKFAIAASGDTRNGASSNATGAPDGSTTEIGANTDYLVLTLEDELPIGTEYTIYISGRAGSAIADVWEAPSSAAIPGSQANSPSGFTQNGQANGPEDVITPVVKTTQVATKYLYFDRGSGDIEIDAIGYCLSTGGQSGNLSCVAGANEITGTVFEDFNYNGLLNTYEYIGVKDISITATDSLGNTFSTTTASDGTYTLTGLTSDITYRVDFTNIPSWASPTFQGGDNGTTVQFLSAANCANLSLASPADYCQINPDFTISCYINGDGSIGDANNSDHAASQDVMVSFSSVNRGEPGDSEHSYPNHIANAAEIGSVWGSAYEKTHEKLFHATFLKRHMGLGNGGLGAIYLTDMATGVNSQFMDLISLGYDFGSIAERNLPENAAEANRDPLAFGLIGEIGMGDLDISADGQTLWTVNLNTKQLMSIDISTYLTTGTIPTATEVSAIAIPDPGCSDGDFRPFGLGIKKGIVYVGVVCSAETSQQITDLRSIVYRYDPVNASFTEVLNISLDYQKGGVHSKAGNNCEKFHPWTDNFDDVYFYEYRYGSSCYPQAILSDIEFDIDGSLILGFTDRYGHQSGGANYSVAVDQPIGYPDPAFADPGVNITPNDNIGNPPLFDGQIGGDILKAFYNADTDTYTLENNGSGGCGAGNGQGPGNGEFYCGETYTSNHFETAMGSLVHIPGTNQVVAPVMDPLSILSGGVVWLSNSNGSATNNDRYEIYQSYRGDPTTFSKAIGLGDIEVLCNPAPIEIGNYVWLDTNADGTQDAGETALSDIRMELYNSNGDLIAFDTTDTRGEYYFSSESTDDATWLTATTSLDFDTDYYIVAGGNGQYAGGTISIEGTDYELTSTDLASGANADNIDNDGAIASGIDSDFDGEPFVQITTQQSGIVRHAYDFGFRLLTNCTDPTASAFAIQPSCVDGAVQSDGYLQLSSVTDGDKVNFSTGSTYSGDPDYANAITIGALPFQFNTGLSNADAGDFTIRVFNGASDCFTDVVLTLNAQDCTVGCDCEEMVYANDASLDEIHKFSINSITGALSEIGNPWLASNIIDNPHGLAADINGRLIIGQANSIPFDIKAQGPLFQLGCDGEVIENDIFNFGSATLDNWNVNYASKDGILYLPDNQNDQIRIYDICTLTELGRMTIITRNSGTQERDVDAWGFYIDDTYWYFPDRETGRIIRGPLDPSQYDAPGSATPTSVSGTELINITIGSESASAVFGPMGMTKDAAGNFYIIFNNVQGTNATAEIRKYDPTFTLLLTVSDNTPVTHTTNGQAGFWGARGIVYNESADLIYVGAQDNCFAVFNTDLVEQTGLNIANPPGGAAKGVHINTECCPTNNNVTIDRTLCAAAINDQLFLQELINCDGTICEGIWAEGASNTGLTYNVCNNSVTIDNLSACGSFTLESDGSSANSKCGAFKIVVNISVSYYVTASAVATDQTICSGGDPDPFAVSTASAGGPLTHQWQVSTTDCATGFTDIAGATSATYDAPSGLTTTSYYRSIVNSINAGCSTGMCADTSNCIIVTVNPNPTANASITDATCVRGSSTINMDGTITLSGFTTGEKYDYVQASTYTGVATFASGSTVIPAGGEIVNNLSSPASSTVYTVRIFTSNECFVDRTVTLNPTNCSCTVPILSSTDSTVCGNGMVELSDRFNTTIGTISYHSSSIPTAGNELASSLVSVLSDTMFYALGTNNGCYDTLSVALMRTALDSSTVCSDGSNSVDLVAISGTNTIAWYNESNVEVGTTDTLRVLSTTLGMEDGTENFYYVLNNASSGCSDGSCCPINVKTEVCLTNFDLALRKDLATNQLDSVKIGSDVDYTITVINEGDVAGSQIQICDIIPFGTRYSPNDTNNWDATNPDTLYYTIPTTLMAGDSIKVNITLQVLFGGKGTSLVNVSEIVEARSETGAVVTDIDSTPRNGEIGEDDIEEEEIILLEHDPTGWVYCEKTGKIVMGGTVTITGPNGIPNDEVLIISDGLNGYYEWYAIGTAGVYTMTYNHPLGIPLSTTRLPITPALDPTGMANPLILGVDTLVGGTHISDTTFADNPYYFEFDIELGDPAIFLNNLPVQCVFIGGVACLDDDLNDIMEGDEPAYEGVKLRLFDCNDLTTPLDSTVSGANGGYQFDGLIEGDYAIEYVAPTGYRFLTSQRDTLVNGFTSCMSLGWGDCDTSKVVCFQLIRYDWGDLPDGTNGFAAGDYQTENANSGPSHLIVGGLKLGATVDAEADGQQSVDAFGDGSDEDGTTIPTHLNVIPEGFFRLELSSMNMTGSTAHMEAWIDWNGDGDFDDTDEMVIDMDDSVNALPTEMTFNVPNDAVQGQLVGFRIRLSNTNDMTPYGEISSGEVEDYLLGIMCKQPICLPVTNTHNE